MSYSPRNIKADLSAMLDKLVIVRLTNNRTYTGILNSYDTAPFLISLTNAKDNENNVFYKVLINGEYISEILLKSSPLFEPREFASFLEKTLGLRSTDIKVYDEAGVVVVLDKIKVTENGVEGSGPMAQKVYDVFNDYIKRKKEGK
ncbi:MAG: Lsm family RNA-binding protein [Sulfolobales archaeon]|nr:Lsm family RNA-binding protein [Sulfolobales archaeon]